MMSIKQFLFSIGLSWLRWLFRLRYKIRIVGLDELKLKGADTPAGILFLPNHPTFFVDPLILWLVLHDKIPARPLITESIYEKPFFKAIMPMINALSVPDFELSVNPIKKKKGDKVLSEVISGLKKGENFLLYPSGRAKHTCYESIGGASSTHQILQECPDCNIVLIRTKGLWGSAFSRAVSDTSELPSQILFALKVLLKNFIYFTPRREIVIEFASEPQGFPRNGTRLELNQALEKWYNVADGLSKQIGSLPGDSLILVSYSMWGEKYLPIRQRAKVEDDEISLNLISHDIQEDVKRKLSALSNMPIESIVPNMSLSNDLALDSLDTADLISFLQDRYNVTAVLSTELTTVAKVMAFAALLIKSKGDEAEGFGLSDKWFLKMEHRPLSIPKGTTIPEVFLKQCFRSKRRIAAADRTSKVMTYGQLKLRAILLANYIDKLPGLYIGIMLPASIAVNVVILACQMAQKIPLMINWTVGARHFAYIMTLTKTEVVISSSAFIDKLKNFDFDDLQDKFLILEDIAKTITIKDKLKAFLLSKSTVKKILNSFGKASLHEEDQAVLLFTSGTESEPKGVPLSHKNILSNLRGSLEVMSVYTDDIVLSMLPPFHSFGFSIGGILGLIAGARVYYTPDPTDGKRVVKCLAAAKATITLGAPTFIRSMLKLASVEDVKSLRLCVTGAEKASADLFLSLKNLGKKDILLEGYGITECSPVLTMNRLNGKQQGVGKAIPGVELCIVNPDTKALLAEGQQGLILAKGPNVFNGYLISSQVDPFIIINGERWYNSGDLGVLDEDGFLTLLGRLKRFIKIGGEMVSLVAIEEAILQGVPENGQFSSDQPLSLAICSKEVPGEKPLLYLFSTVNIDVELANAALKKAGYSNLFRISRVKVLPELPKMGTGKINYRQLQTIVQNEKSEGVLIHL